MAKKTNTPADEKALALKNMDIELKFHINPTIVDLSRDFDGYDTNNTPKYKGVAKLQAFVSQLNEIAENSGLCRLSMKIEVEDAQQYVVVNYDGVPTRIKANGVTHFLTTLKTDYPNVLVLLAFAASEAHRRSPRNYREFLIANKTERVVRDDG